MNLTDFAPGDRLRLTHRRRAIVSGSPVVEEHEAEVMASAGAGS